MAGRTRRWLGRETLRARGRPWVTPPVTRLAGEVRLRPRARVTGSTTVPIDPFKGRRRRPADDHGGLPWTRRSARGLHLGPIEREEGVPRRSAGVVCPSGLASRCRSDLDVGDVVRIIRHPLGGLGRAGPRSGPCRSRSARAGGRRVPVTGIRRARADDDGGVAEQCADGRQFEYPLGSGDATTGARLAVMAHLQPRCAATGCSRPRCRTGPRTWWAAQSRVVGATSVCDTSHHPSSGVRCRAPGGRVAIIPWVARQHVERYGEGRSDEALSLAKSRPGGRCRG